MIDAWVVVWGTRYPRQARGRVADFCPLCRKVCAVQLFHVTELHHVYFFLTVPGDNEAHEIQCDSCATIYQVHPAIYSHYAQNGANDVFTLAKTTNPLVFERFAERLALEESLGNSHGMGTEARLTLLLESFVALRPEIEIGPSGGRKKGLVFGLALLMCLLVAASGDAMPRYAPALTSTAWIVVFLIVALWIYTHRTYARRVIRKRLLPRIARALRPLSPNDYELESILKHLAAKGDPFARYINSADLLNVDLQAPCFRKLKPVHAMRPSTNDLILSCEALLLDRS